MTDSILGSLDSLTRQSIRPGQFNNFVGWAVLADQTPINEIEIFHGDLRLGACEYGYSRPDVYEDFPFLPLSKFCGFSGNIFIPKFLNGKISVIGLDSNGRKHKIAELPIGTPLGRLRCFFRAKSIRLKERALMDALNRQKEPEDNRFRRMDYRLEGTPLVSILIPTKDQPLLLNRCLESIFQKTTYKNFEVLVIDNGSKSAETRKVIERWSVNEPLRFRSFIFDIPFNYSKLNNRAVEKSRGELLLFLNDDTEVISADWIESMASQAQRASIGAVGALLLFKDGSIQHAGTMLNEHNDVVHRFVGLFFSDFNANRYFLAAENVSAVTGACLMCRKSIFQEAGGFDENLAVAFNDVDLCLKMRARGYRNLFLPYVRLTHHESQSRGPDNESPEKSKRFEDEKQTMKRSHSPK